MQCVHVNKTNCGACISSSMWLLYTAELAILQSQHCYVYCWWHVQQTLGGGRRCRLKPTPSFGPKSFNLMSLLLCAADADREEVQAETELQEQALDQIGAALGDMRRLTQVPALIQGAVRGRISGLRYIRAAVACFHGGQ